MIDEKDCKEITRNLIHSPFIHKMAYCEMLSFTPINMDDVIPVMGGLTTDEDAEKLMENVILPGTVKVPCEIGSDGNCLPRCGSFFAYADQEYHTDMRVRLAVEMIKYQHCYLSKEYLARGWPMENVPVPTPESYLQLCSRYYCRQDHNDIEITEMYNKEVNDLLTANTYMGMLQMFPLASVLGCPIVSVYPAKGDPVAQRNLHRLILPRECIHPHPRFIM